MKKKASKNDTSINELAIMVAKGFGSITDDMNSRFNSIDKRFNEVDKKLSELSEDVKTNRRNILEVGDRFVPRFEFDNLLFRVSKLEQKNKRKV